MPFEPSVSIVIVNLNGLRHLDECFKSIQRLDYPKDKIEVILVDNGSQDDSVKFIQEKYRWVKVIRNTKNEGFAKPSNDGARAASGEYVAFLNNDMKVQKRWLAELVASIERNQAVCAGSVILNWNGELLDFAGGSVSFYGMGYQHHFHEPVKTLEPQLRQDKEIFFACGGAMLIRRDVFLQTGGFDEDYFAYFEDVDLGWRLRVLGHKVVLSAASRVYHKHHSTGKRFARERMWLLYQRNSLYTIYKNFSDEMLGKTFWPTVLMNQAILFESLKVDRDAYDLRMTHEDFKTSGVQLSHQSVAELCATYDFIHNLKIMTDKRRFIQQNRKTSDEEIIPFITDPFVCLGKTGMAYHQHIYDFAKMFQIDQAFHTQLRRKVLLISSGKVAQKMLGPAIRYFEFAKCLSASCDVILASAGETDLSVEQFQIFDYVGKESKLVKCAEQADIILLQGFILEDYPVFARVAKQKYLIVDLYDPYVIENLEVLKDHDPAERKANYVYSGKTLENQLQMGDFFLAANQKQQDYWMGMLSSLGRVSPKVYDLSRNLNRLIGTVPFGIQDEAPVHTRSVLKGVWPGIGKDDFLLIWGGGVWNWFDPLTVIRAVGEITKTRKDIKLFFLGVKHPNPDLPEMKMLAKAVQLAKDLQLYDTQVFFNFDWVDYNDRQNYLLEADAGVSCHFDTLETRFSFRTRILDYLWAGLPIIGTQGDYFADLVQTKELGVTVGFEHVREMADAILKLADDKAFYAHCKENIAPVAEEYRWSRVSRPIMEFCKDPVHLREMETLSADGEEHSARSDMEHGGFPAAGGKRPARRGSVQQMLYDIEQRQIDLQKSMHRVARDERDANERLAELQTWSYMMNDRFNKFKGIASPFKFLKRLFRRR